MRPPLHIEFLTELHYQASVAARQCRRAALLLSFTLGAAHVGFIALIERLSQFGREAAAFQFVTHGGGPQEVPDVAPCPAGIAQRALRILARSWGFSALLGRGGKLRFRRTGRYSDEPNRSEIIET